MAHIQAEASAKAEVKIEMEGVTIERAAITIDRVEAMIDMLGAKIEKDHHII